MPDEGSESEILKQLKDQNAILTEQISLFTNQKSLAKLFFPTLPEGLEGTFELKGDFAIEGTAAAYESVKLLAQQWVDHLEGRLTDADIQRVAEFRCRELKGGEYRECLKVKTEELRGLTLKPTLDRVMILREQEINGLFNFQAFMAKLSQLDSRLKEVIPDTADEKSVTALIPVAIIGAAFEAALGVAALFKKNVEITTTSVEVDEIALVAAVSEELRFRRVEVVLFYPAGFPPRLNENSGMLDTLAKINVRMERLVRKIGEEENSKSKIDATVESAQAEIKKLDANITYLVALIERLKNSGAPPEKIDLVEQQLKKAREDKAATEQRKATAETESKQRAENLKGLKQLRDVIDAFRNNLLIENAAGASPLTTLLRIEKISKELSSDKHVMQVKLHRAGASTKSKTTFFGGTKASVGGGAVASFVLYSSADGKICASGVFSAKQKMSPLGEEQR